MWWAFYWRTSLISWILTIPTAYGLRQVYENTSTSAALIGWAQPILPYASFYLPAIFVIRLVLHKNFRHFRIALSAQTGVPASQPLEPTFARAIRVWWIYSWRTVVYGIVAFVIVSYPMGLTLGLFAPGPVVMGLFATGLGIAVAAGVGLFVIYSNILDEDIGDFHVSLLPRLKEQEPVVVDATPRIAVL